MEQDMIFMQFQFQNLTNSALFSAISAPPRFAEIFLMHRVHPTSPTVSSPWTGGATG